MDSTRRLGVFCEFLREEATKGHPEEVDRVELEHVKKFREPVAPLLVRPAASRVCCGMREVR